MSALGEFDIIERYFSSRARRDGVLVGIGDDAAIIEADGAIAAAVDMLVAGTHFPETLPADAVGHRALAVNLSDLAAVAARPRWATLALCIPEADESWLGAFADGFFRLADRFGVSLIGGDTTRGPLTMTVQVLGDAARHTLLRSGGREGDLIFVSGTFGDSAAGLGRLQRADDHSATDALIMRFSYPEPRVALGIALAGIAHAAIDVSDGLLADLGHICRQSGCAARLDVDAVPLSESLRAVCPPEQALELALTGGDDYELCFTAAPADEDAVFAAADKAETPVTPIGRLTAGNGITAVVDGEPTSLELAGYRHF